MPWMSIFLNRHSWISIIRGLMHILLNLILRLLLNFRSLLLQHIILPLDHLLKCFLVDGLLAMLKTKHMKNPNETRKPKTSTNLLQLLLKLLAALDEFPLLGLELLFDLLQLGLELLLVHRQRLYLSLQHLHSTRGHDGPNVRHHRLGKDLVDQPVVPQVTGIGDVLHGITVVLI